MKVVDLDKLAAHLNDEIDKCSDTEHKEDLRRRDFNRGVRIGLRMAIAYAATIAREEGTPKDKGDTTYYTVVYHNCSVATIYADSTFLNDTHWEFYSGKTLVAIIDRNLVSSVNCCKQY